MDIETYIMSDGEHYNIGRIFKDAGFEVVNAYLLEAYERGEVALTPEFQALVVEALRRNAALDSRPVLATNVFGHRRSEWDARGSRDGE